jgi:hypothetical protein
MKMSDRRLPHFIVIGAAKAATTWIAYQLRSKDCVYMPGPEPHYFSREFYRGERWYHACFADAKEGQYIGEKSADYLASERAAARIAAIVPKAGLVAQLRNPVERAYSDYCMLFRRGQVSGDIARQLNPATTDAPRFLNDGLYARHLSRYLDHFPAEQLSVVLYEDIKARPAEVLDQTCDALGIPRGNSPASLDARVNDGKAALAPLAFRKLPKPLKDLAAPLRGHPLFEAARSLIARPVAYPPLTDGLRRQLEDFYHDDIVTLGRLIGRDVSGWLARDRAVPQ